MGGNMKVWMLVVATWLCCCSTRTAESASKACPTTNVNYNNNDLTFNYGTVSFTIDDDTSSESYVSFVDELRNEVKSDEKSYGIPILCQKSKVLPGKDYLMLELSYYRDSITLAIDVTDLNLVAYKAGTTSYFFKNFYQDLKDKFFGNAQKKVQIPFNVRYSALGERDDVELGLSALQDSIKALREYDSTQMKNIKKAVVVVSEMILEAARLNIVERQVTTDFHNGFYPVDDVFSYEDNWKALSKAIQNSKEGDFEEPIELLTPNGSPKEVTKVNQVQKNMGLLLKAKSSEIDHDRGDDGDKENGEKDRCGIHDDRDNDGDKKNREKDKSGIHDHRGDDGDEKNREKDKSGIHDGLDGRGDDGEKKNGEQDGPGIHHDHDEDGNNKNGEKDRSRIHPDRGDGDNKNGEKDKVRTHHACSDGGDKKNGEKERPGINHERGDDGDKEKRLSMANACAELELMWLKSLMFDACIKHPQPLITWCDNIGAIYSSFRPIFQACTKPRLIPPPC